MDVKASVLEKVIQFCTHHADPQNAFPDIEKVRCCSTACISAPRTTPTAPPAPQPLKTANLAEVVPAWDASFVEVEQEMLFELILVSAPPTCAGLAGGSTLSSHLLRLPTTSTSSPCWT